MGAAIATAQNSTRGQICGTAADVHGQERVPVRGKPRDREDTARDRERVHARERARE